MTKTGRIRTNTGTGLMKDEGRDHGATLGQSHALGAGTDVGDDLACS